MLLVSSAILGDAEKDALNKVIDSGWLSMGARVLEFEAAFARLHGAQDSVAVSNCTAALHLILQALGVGAGDEVLVPSLTFVATANAVLYVDAKPVFVDIESNNVPLMSLADAEARCTDRTKAIILVHFAGYLADREQWREFARRKGLFIIEDAAHAPGLKEVGTFGDAAAFSFYGNKNMTTGEGGAVIARDPDVLQRVRCARGHGMSSSTHQRLTSRTPIYDVVSLGFNYRLDELRAAVGLAQLEKLPDWNKTRSMIAAHYRRIMNMRCPEVMVPFEGKRISAHHILPVLLPARADRQSVIDALRDKNIQTTIHYPPLHLMTMYRRMFPDVSLPLTEAFCARELTLPLHPLMTKQSVEDVVDALRGALGGREVSGRAA